MNDEIHNDIVRAKELFDARDAYTAREIAQHIAEQWGKVDEKSDLMRIEGITQRVRALMQQRTKPEEIAKAMLEATTDTFDLFAETLQQRYSIARSDEQVYVKPQAATDAELLDVVAKFRKVSRAAAMHADALERYVYAR